MKKKSNDPWRLVGLLGTLGFEMVFFILGGVLLGRYLDDHFQTKPTWLAIGILVGLALGIVSAWYTLNSFIKD